MAHGSERGDPCPLVGQVKEEIIWLDSTLPKMPKPLPARPAGESDFLAGMTVRSILSNCSATAFVGFEFAIGKCCAIRIHQHFQSGNECPDDEQSGDERPGDK